MKVVIYGAGGPVAKAAVKSLENRHVLRLTDLNLVSLKDYDDRHEKLKCDIAEEEEVVQAAAGMDAIINCTVLRDHPVASFDVNCRGAYNVMRAAKAHGIRKVIHTGPQLIHSGHMGDYMTDWGLPDDLPPRPGTAIYLLSKYLGQEICRIYAEEEGIPVITLLFSNFVDSAKSLAQQRLGRGFYPYTVSWDDTGESFRCALEVGELPRPFEIFDILADIPHGVLSPSKAKRLLGWQPKDNFEADWRRPVEPASADKK